MKKKVCVMTGCQGEDTADTAALPMENCYIDLHLHVDGAMSVDTALALAEMQDITLPATDREALTALLSASPDCRDLNEYLEKFDLPCSLLQTKEAISEMIYQLQEELKEHGVMYAELRFAPQKHTDLGLTQDEVVQAAIEGLNRSDLKANLILCCMRGEGLEAANMETIRVASQYVGQGVVAVDLAGAKALFPTADYKDVFDYAKELGVRFTIHAGEADGADSVRTAIAFGAERIGHGVRSAEDEALMAELKEKSIPLELCITSNFQTKAVEDLESYPLRKLMENGVIVTLNTDNPMVSSTNIETELLLAQQSFALTQEEFHTILQNAIAYSFADDGTKEELTKQLEDAFKK